ncbi:uncharacterized protein LOC107263001 isoform X2 [Cephus cinctus]|uniref:Uncharacterized protein LOC107263001 isoform X2 n=1 Tax=Cephus cinctus TaxID=211228 RepID=A0AAJ7VWV7_CEPCN|nr:uncharacterized protein LOC107263001 isoform X2 [Cephus cinctus]
MATVEDDSFQNLKSHSMHPAEKLEWVPLSLTLVEYPHASLACPIFGVYEEIAGRGG